MEIDKGKEVSRREIPEVSLVNPKTLFTKANSKIGWMLYGRLVLLGIFISGVAKSASARNGDPTLNLLFLFVWISFAIYFARSVAKKEYGIELGVWLWPFFWRMVVAIFVCSAIVLVPLAFYGITAAPVLKFVVFLAVILYFYLQPLFLGWALHQQLRVFRPVVENHNVTQGAVGEKNVEPENVSAPVAVASVSAGSEDKLLRLKKMVDNGLISPDDYETQKAAILEAFLKNGK